MVPDKPQKVENFHFTWCGYIGFRARCYVKTLFILFDLQVAEKNWEEGMESEAHMAPDTKVAHLL